MTLSVSDVEKWNPARLTDAGTSVGTLSTNLDKTVNGGIDATHKLRNENQWDGRAADAAEARMDAEKTRTSAVGQALLDLQKALSQQADNLENTKKSVLAARDRAQHPGPDETPPPDPFDVADNGVVTADKRKAYWAGQTGLKPQEIQDKQLQEDHKAAAHQTEITNALKQAETVAESAVAAVTAAKTKLQAAYDGLGDPHQNTSIPASTAPAAVATPAAPSTGNAPTYSGSPSHATGGTSHSSGGTQATPNHDYRTVSYSGPTSGSPPGVKPTGDVAQWIAQAKQVLIEMGYPPDQIDENAIALIIEKESGGDPNAINNWDSNAAAGHPSKGLMQTIDSTFNAYAAPGHGDIWNPVDNIVAATRYSIATYGSVDSVPGVVSWQTRGEYQGY